MYNNEAIDYGFIGASSILMIKSNIPDNIYFTSIFKTKNKFGEIKNYMNNIFVID